MTVAAIAVLLGCSEPQPGTPSPFPPRIRLIADAPQRFLRGNALAPSAWTLPSHVSLFTGIDAVRHGVNYRDREAAARFTMLAEVLRAAGYTTAAVTGGGYLHPRFGFTQGLDAYDYWGRDQVEDPLRENEPEVASGMDRALAFIESNAERPFFLFFHTYEVHAPYRRPDPFLTSRHPGTTVSGAVADVVPGRPARPENGFMPDSAVVWRRDGGLRAARRRSGLAATAQGAWIYPLAVPLPRTQSGTSRVG